MNSLDHSHNNGYDEEVITVAEALTRSVLRLAQGHRAGDLGSWAINMGGLAAEPALPVPRLMLTVVVGGLVSYL